MVPETFFFLLFGRLYKDLFMETAVILLQLDDNPIVLTRISLDARLTRVVCYLLYCVF